MGPDILMAAIAAAHIHHAAALGTIQQNAAGTEGALSTEASRFATEVAALGCSSVPPCVTPNQGTGHCATQRIESLRRIVPSGAMIKLNGVRWIAQSVDQTVSQSRGLTLNDDGSVDVNAKSGDHAWFDPPRKIRAEFCGIQRFGKGSAISAKFKLRVSFDTSVAGLDWSSVAQIHQADMRYADGNYVPASPIFAIDLQSNGPGDTLTVRGETASQPLREPKMDVATRRQAMGPDGPQWTAHFAPIRVLGHSQVLARGAWHQIDFRFVDGHGRQGSVAVSVDGRVVVDNPSLPTGYSYIDDLAPVPFAGGPQDTGSYVKFGIYAGVDDGSAPPKSGPIHLQFKDVVVTPAT